ncbi:MAG TPA: Cu(I)-responsive transcriptional regulator [Candidatus Acidoferrum sp.]|nr:Cu(I)-responsive transcriptional regulator [Candidatus Acidoferrum sp.]
MPRTPSPAQPEMADARKAGLLNIGEAASASGVSAKSIRHYEESGLLKPAVRSAANYRLYSQADVHTLRFIKSARGLGFSVADIARLVQLWQNQQRNSSEVKQLALQHVGELDARIAEMQRMRDSLQKLAQSCHGDTRPECPIIDDLAGHCC